jgi:hypothetical protein
MQLLRRALEATVSGLLIALLAPPVAAVMFILLSAVASTLPNEQFASALGSVVLLLLGVTSGAYLLGALPAFAAGLALPSLQRALSPLLAAGCSGVIGAVVYAATFGAHLASGPAASWPYCALPVFTGVAVAALLAQRIERRHTEA